MFAMLIPRLKNTNGKVDIDKKARFFKKVIHNINLTSLLMLKQDLVEELCIKGFQFEIIPLNS